MDILIAVLLVGSFLAAVYYIFFIDGPRIEAQQQQQQQQQQNSSPATQMTVGPPPHQNQIFLQSVRERSCYRMLREVHGILTFAAIGAIVFAWIALLIISDNTGDCVYATLVCGLVVVVAVIEYGFFRMVVDAVDVLIDTSRRNAGDKISE